MSKNPTPTSRTGSGRAPGKVILFGEHAVVYGGLAIAGSIDRYLHATVRRRDVSSPSMMAPRVAEALQRAGRALAIETDNLETVVDGDLPPAVGLGSSAALSVALVRALASFARRRLTAAAVCTVAFELEKIFHGSPSGIDNSAATFGGFFSFQSGQKQPLHAPALDLVIALGASPRATHTAIAGLRARRDREFGAIGGIFSAIDALAREAQPALAGGQRSMVGRLMRCNHELLRALGVSTPELDSMVALAHRNGAFGAKLTGGGGGGAVVCLPADAGSLLIDAFLRAGWRAFGATIGGSRKDVDANAHRHDPAYAIAQY